jgi:6-bladed beta-propeller protein/NHL repeat-containing protein
MNKLRFSKILALCCIFGFVIMDFNVINFGDRNENNEIVDLENDLQIPNAQFSFQTNKKIYNSSMDPGDLAVGSNGLIYIVEPNGHRVSVYSQNSNNSVNSWGSYGTSNGQFDTCSSIDIGSNDLVYVADKNNDRVQVFNLTGGFQFSFTAHKPSGIDILPNGTVYVTEFNESRVKVFNSVGIPQRTVTVMATPDSIAVTDEYIIVGESAGVSMYPKIYYQNGTEWGSFSGSTQHWPKAITTNASNYIFVSDSEEGPTIVIYYPNLTFYGYMPYSPSGGNVQGLAFTESNELLASDYLTHDIIFFTSADWSIPSIKCIPISITQNIFNSTVLGQDIAVGPDNLIYVVDGYTNRITVFNQTSSNYIREWGTYGSADGEFYECSSIDINASGYIYVADRENNRIQVFNLTGGFQFSFPATKPTGIDILPNGTVYVAEFNESRVKVFTAQGNEIKTISSIDSPNSIAVTEDHIFVGSSTGDYGNVHVYYHNGTFLKELSDGSNEFPAAITTNSSGYIFVSENSECFIEIYYPNLTYYARVNFSAPKTAKLVGLAFMGDDTLVISDNYQYNITVLTSTDWGGYIPPQIPNGPIPSELVYQIKYLGSIVEWWKFTGYYYGKNTYNHTLFAQVQLWSSIEKVWKPHPDFPNSTIPVGVWDDTKDIWYPHHPYSGAWGIDGNRGHSVPPIVTDNTTHTIILELPNLWHLFTPNALGLQTLYTPNATLLKTGESFVPSISGNSSIVLKNITAANGDPVLANLLANNLSSTPHTILKHQTVSTIQKDNLSVVDYYFRETTTYEFEMVLDLDWRSDLCNITNTFWGKEVGDIIETEEIIDGKKYKVQYEITTIDDCTVRQIKVNQEMIATKDPIFGIPCSSVYGQKQIWNSTLNKWVNVTSEGVPLSAQNSGQSLLGASFSSLPLPFIWTNTSEAPLFSNGSALTMMMLMPLSTGGPKASSDGSLYSTNILSIGKLFPYIKNVTGPANHPRMTFEANDTDFLLDVSSNSMYASFLYGGIPCYLNMTMDSNTSIISYSGYLPSENGFSEFSVKFMKYIPAGSNSDDSLPPAPPSNDFDIMDYIWYLITGVALIGVVIIVIRVVKKPKKKEVAAEEEPKMDFKI